MRRAKIVATIGPASDSEALLRKLVVAGMDVARINMLHGEREHHGEVIARIRGIAGELGKAVAVMLDLSGPKIRTGRLRGGQARLAEGALVRITSEEIEGDAHRFSTNYPLLARDVHPRERILVSDGELELQVMGVEDGEVVARVVHGGALGEHKGVNLPGTQISIPSVTEKDVADLRFGVERGVDLVAQSFVRSAADCVRVRDLIKEFGGNAKLIAKIEKPEAVADLTAILSAVDGVMVARGDLAVETATEQVPVLQKKIISEAFLAEKRIVTATQMLQSMIENPRPTRAEASDVSNAVLDGTDAVMLSGETAIGRFPVETVATMDRIIRTTEEMLSPATTTMRQIMFGRRSGSLGRAVAQAAVVAAEESRSRLIVVITQSGHMAYRIAALRPRQRIVALTPSHETFCQLPLLWGVEPYLLRGFSAGSDDLLTAADHDLVDYRLAKPGENVVVMAGRLRDISISLSMKLHRVGDLAAAR